MRGEEGTYGEQGGRAEGKGGAMRIPQRPRVADWQSTTKTSQSEHLKII